MKTIIALSLLFLSPPALADELWLKVGEVRALPAAPSAKVRVGSRSILRAVDSGKVVRVLALKAGWSSLVIDSKVYSVRVTPAEQREFAQALAKQIKGMMGLKMEMRGADPVVSGTLLRFSDWQELADLARHHSGRYIFKAQALPDVAQMALQFLQKMALNRGYPILRFTAAPEFTAILPKSASGLRPAVENSLSPFGIRVESSESNLALQPLVKTRVILAEVERNFSRQFGIKWPGEYAAQVLPKLSVEAGLEATLVAMEEQGHAQILASPNLLCRSGSEARFHAGGEFPIKIASHRFQDVVWKQHGVVLKVKPRADFQGAISLEIETEISMLDMAHAVDGIPALKVNTVKSHFDLPGKRTIALSGLLRQETGNKSDGLPLLGQIPVLGALFSSKNFQNHQSELVIFVTPEITSPETDEPIKMPEGWVQDE